MSVKLRPHQTKACEQVYKHWTQYDSTLVSMATGSGKSYVIGSVAEAWSGHDWGGTPLGDRVLVLSHRDEIIWQLYRAIKTVTGDSPAVEKGEHESAETGFLDKARYVVSSIQTMSKNHRRDRFSPNEFGLVIIDEAHHAVAPTYIETLTYFCQGGAKVLGVTATPDRCDEVSLGKVFDSVAYEYDILDGIKEGYLAPIKQYMCEVEGLSWKGIKTSGELPADEIARIIKQEDMLHRMAAPAIDIVGDRQTIFFVPSQTVSDDLAEIINRYKPGSAASVHSRTDEELRPQIVEDYRSGRIQYLVNCMLFTEGFDAPETSAIGMFRPTLSRSLYSQMIGRGLRGGFKAPVKNKKDLLVVDFCGNSKHKLIGPVDILGGCFEDVVLDEVLSRVRESSAGGESIDVAEELAQAALIADELKRKKRQEILAKAQAKKKMVDPFDVLDLPDRMMPGFYEGKRPSQKMLEMLEGNGVPTGNLSYWKAKRLIEEIVHRQKEGLCTYKQASVLGRFGHDTSMSMEEATETLDRLFQGKGKPWKNFTGKDWKKFHQAKKAKAAKQGKDNAIAD